MKLAWSPLARVQLLEAFTYLAARNYDAAVKDYERIVERTSSLSVLPELGHPGREPGTRELTVIGTRYVVVYRVSGDVVQVVAVWHGKQSRRSP